jgi:hypothetical protein
MRQLWRFAFYVRGLGERTKDRQLRITALGFCKPGKRLQAWKSTMKLDIQLYHFHEEISVAFVQGDRLLPLCA